MTWKSETIQITDGDVVMTRAQVAAWLKISLRQVGRLDIPCVDLGSRTKRYRMQDVQSWLEARRTGLTDKQS